MKHPFKFTFMIPLIKTQLNLEKLFIQPDRANSSNLAGSGLIYTHTHIQFIFVFYRPLVDIINGTANETVRVKCANAIEALAQDNLACQQTFLRIKAPTALKKLLKVFRYY